MAFSNIINCFLNGVSYAIIRSFYVFASTGSMSFSFLLTIEPSLKKRVVVFSGKLVLPYCKSRLAE